MPDNNSKRPVTRKEVWGLALALFFIGIPFFAATVLRKIFPNHAIITTLFDVWWKRVLIIIVGSLIAWLIAKVMDRNKKRLG